MDETWTECVVKQATGTSGFCVTQIVGAVSDAVGADLVFPTGIDGAIIGDVPVNRLIAINVFINACSAVKQYDWADIYLLKISDKFDIISLEKLGNYPTAIQQSRATIRVVDGEYMYIYVRSNNALALQERITLFAKPIERRLSEFIYPI